MMRAFLSLIFSCMFAACASASTSLNLPQAAFWGGNVYWSQFGTVPASMKSNSWYWVGSWLPQVTSTSDTTNYVNYGINLFINPTGSTDPNNVRGLGAYMIPDRPYLHQGSETIGYLVSDEQDLNLGPGLTASNVWYSNNGNPGGGPNIRTVAPTNNVTISQGSTSLTSSNAAFTAADVQSPILIPGAGVAGAPLVTTITAVSSGTQATLAQAASTALSSVNEYVLIGISATGSGYGTNVTGNVSVTAGQIAGSSSDTVTVTGAAFTSSGSGYPHIMNAGDVGDLISIPGAGPAGATLYSRIVAVNSATQVVISDSASTTLSAVSKTVSYAPQCGDSGATGCGANSAQTGSLALHATATWNGGAPLTVNGFGTGVDFFETAPQAAQFLNAGQDVSEADMYWYNSPNFIFSSYGGVKCLHNGGGANMTIKQSRRAYCYGQMLDWQYSLQTVPYNKPITGIIEIGYPFAPNRQVTTNTNVTIANGQAVLTTSGSLFTAGDVGSAIAIKGAGPSGTGGQNWLFAHILTFTSATQVTLDTNASAALTAQNEEVDYRYEWNYPSSGVTIALNSTSLTVNGATFTSSDVNNWITIPGAGANGAALVTQITGFTDATHITLLDPALTALSGVAESVRYSYMPGTTGPEDAGAGMAVIIHGANGVNWFPQQFDSACHAGQDIFFNSTQCASGDAGNTYVASTGVSITSGQTALTVVGASFVSGDVGKTIVIPGAGFNGGPLLTTIATWTDGTHVGLTATAMTTISAVTERVGYGTGGLLWVWYFNGYLQALAPELNTLSYVWNFTPGCGSGSCGDTMLKQGPDGNAYIFAMGYTAAGDPAGSLTFSLPPQLCGNASAVVLNEGRSLTVSNCQFTDPNYTHEYDQHVYQLSVANVKNIGWRRGPL